MLTIYPHSDEVRTVILAYLQGYVDGNTGLDTSIDYHATDNKIVINYIFNASFRDFVTTIGNLNGVRNHFTFCIE